MAETTQAPTEALVRQEAPKAQELVKMATQAIVKTDQEYIDAKTFRKNTVAYFKHWDTEEKEATKPILQGLEKVRSWFRPIKEAAKQAKEIIDPKITAFETEREQARLAEEAKLREQARVKEQKLLEQAKALEAKGKTVQAAAKVEAAQSIPTPAVMPSIPKVEGTYHREEWDAEIVDRKLVPYEYWLIDEAKIKKIVKANDGNIDIPGVRNFKKRIQASRST